MENNYNKNDVLEMIFLTNRKEKLMSVEELIVFDYFLKVRLQKLSEIEKIKITKLKNELTKILMDYDWGN